MSIILKVVSSGILFAVTVCMGIVLNSLGKPYNIALFAVHKIVALCTVIITAILIKSLAKNIEIKTIILILIIVAILAVLGLFITGALMSTGAANYRMLLVVHNIAAIMAAAVIAALAYFLLFKRV